MKTLIRTIAAQLQKSKETTINMKELQLTGAKIGRFFWKRFKSAATATSKKAEIKIEYQNS